MITIYQPSHILVALITTRYWVLFPSMSLYCRRQQLCFKRSSMLTLCCQILTSGGGTMTTGKTSWEAKAKATTPMTRRYAVAFSLKTVSWWALLSHAGWRYGNTAVFSMLSLFLCQYFHKFMFFTGQYLPLLFSSCIHWFRWWREWLLCCVYDCIWGYLQVSSLRTNCWYNAQYYMLQTCTYNSLHLHAQHVRLCWTLYCHTSKTVYCRIAFTHF
jgi:hypothetical protein